MRTRSLSSPKSVVRSHTAPSLLVDVALLAQPLDGSPDRPRVVQVVLGNHTSKSTPKSSRVRLISANWAAYPRPGQRDCAVGGQREEVGRSPRPGAATSAT